MKDVVAKVMPAELLGNETVYHINPTGSFEIGGPDGDAGITGRKIIVDTYGGAAPHGGGAFSGKDPTKVDRSAAYAARYLAKNIVAAGFASRCTIQLAYAIGVSKPLSLYVDTHGTGSVGDDQLEEAIGKIEKLGGLTPRGIRTHLALNKPIYQATAAYGHFGRKSEGDFFPWEKTDLVDDLKAAVAALRVGLAMTATRQATRPRSTASMAGRADINCARARRTWSKPAAADRGAGGRRTHGCRACSARTGRCTSKSGSAQASISPTVPTCCPTTASSAASRS